MSFWHDKGVQVDIVAIMGIGWSFDLFDLCGQATMKQVLDLAVKDSRNSWLANLLPSKSSTSPALNSTVPSLQLKFESEQFSPLKEISVKVSSSHPVSKLTATARPRMQPKSRTASRSRGSCCRVSVQEFWDAPINEALSLCLPLEV